MKIMRRWIKRAFSMQKEIKTIKERNLYLDNLVQKWKRKYIEIIEHNVYLQENIASLCNRLEESEEWD